MQNDELVKQQAKEKIIWVTKSLEKGCGRSRCFSKYCSSNPKVAPLKKELAFKEAISLVNKDIYLCNKDKIVQSPQGSDFAELLKDEKGLIEQYAPNIYDVFSNHLALNFAFVEGGKVLAVNEKHPLYDFEAITSFRTMLERHGLENPVLKKNVLSALDKIVESLTAFIKGGYFDTGIELRVYPLLTMFLANLEGEYEAIFIRVVNLYQIIPADKQKLLREWYGQSPRKEFSYVVDNLRNKVSSKFLSKQPELESMEMLMLGITSSVDHSDLIPFLEFLGILHKSNIKRLIIPSEEFYIEVITDEANFKEQLRTWILNKKNNTRKFTFIDYPWVLECAYKAKILEIECQLEKDKVMVSSYNNMLGNMMGGPDALMDALYLKIEVRRDRLIEDTLNKLNKPNLNFKKTLKVKFTGEQGVDEGGVRKEFFQLMTKQLFDPTFTMFIPASDNRYLWFNQHSYECNVNFELCGIVLGLSIYNSINLDLKFPHVVYKKLLDEEVTFEDLQWFDITMYKNLKKLLEYNGDDVEEVFGLVFQIQQEYLGHIHDIDLIKDGGKIPVTSKNKEEYVNRYVDWIFNESINTQFKSFYKGFQKVVSNSSIKLFTGDELNSLICGSEVLNFAELEKVTHYEGGYTKDSPVIKNFWEVIQSLSEEEKKKFLFFCTGSDRAPIKGLGTLEFVIERHGEDSERLPSAHTCFNHFLLPEYSSKEKLKKKILLAIDNSQGFGLI